MTETAQRLKSELARLPPGDRAELIRFLIDTLDEGEDVDAEAQWDAELSRRLDDIKTGRVQGRPGDTVFAEIRKRLS